MARRSDHTRPELKAMAIESARQIIKAEGLRTVSIRRIAEAMGYTSGTLYQLFENLDELIVEVHIETLSEMFKVLDNVKLSDDPGQSLMDLSQAYTDSAGDNKNLWNALFIHSLPDGVDLPERYTQAVGRLIEIIAMALGPIFRESGEDEETARHQARVLWASFYGIVSLETAKKLPNFEQAEELTRSLVQNYLAGLQSNHRKQ